MQTQIMLQSKLSDDDSAHCTYNLEDCGYYIQECKSNGNCTPMQLTVNLCCVYNYPVQSLEFHKITCCIGHETVLEISS